MAHHLQPQLFILILFLLTINHLIPTQSTQLNHPFLLKLTKDLKSHQHTTQLLIGTPQFPSKLVFHLSGQSTYINCPPSSHTRTFIKHNSLQCLMAKSGDQKTKSFTLCNVHQQNPITGETNDGDLVEDIVTVDGAALIGSISTVYRFLFSCSPESLLSGLVAGANGVLGFGRSKIGFQSQIVNNFDSPRKFAVCLSSSDGFIISGAGAGVYNSLSYTPLVSSMDGYYVNVNSIRINGRRLAGGQPIGRVEISSTVPYTVMKSTLYRDFVKAFVSSMNMTLVSPVAPFGVCFSSPATVPVPEIELVLQSELVKWRIQGRNSMVEVSDSVLCLGVVDGGLGMSGEMILGGYQLEDHMVEFNLGTGMMGFSSSLLMEGNSCSKIRAMVSTPREIL